MQTVLATQKNDSDMILKLMKQLFPHLSTDGASKVLQRKVLYNAQIPPTVHPHPMRVLPKPTPQLGCRTGRVGDGGEGGTPAWASQSPDAVLQFLALSAAGPEGAWSMARTRDTMSKGRLQPSWVHSAPRCF